MEGSTPPQRKGLPHGLSAQLITNPDELTTRQLGRIPSGVFSRDLRRDLPAHTTFMLHIRWLEAHRLRYGDEISDSNHWSLQFHWFAKALRDREMDLKEIKDRLYSWRRANPGLLVDRLSYAGLTFPTLRDLDITWAEMQRQDQNHDQGCVLHTEPDKQQANDPELQTTLSVEIINLYRLSTDVCNRCEKTGHHIAMCPTNSDPNFEVNPASDHVCKWCNKYGEHYSDLCTKLRLPDSMFINHQNGSTGTMDCNEILAGHNEDEMMGEPNGTNSPSATLTDIDVQQVSFNMFDDTPPRTGLYQEKEPNTGTAPKVSERAREMFPIEASTDTTIPPRPRRESALKMWQAIDSRKAREEKERKAKLDLRKFNYIKATRETGGPAWDEALNDLLNPCIATIPAFKGKLRKSKHELEQEARDAIAADASMRDADSGISHSPAVASPNLEDSNDGTDDDEQYDTAEEELQEEDEEMADADIPAISHNSATS